MHRYIFQVREGNGVFKFVQVTPFEFWASMIFEKNYQVDVICKYRIKLKQNV